MSLFLAKSLNDPLALTNIFTRKNRESRRDKCADALFLFKEFALSSSS